MPTSTQTIAELTREQVLTTLVKPLEAASVFLAAGPRIIDTSAEQTAGLDERPLEGLRATEQLGHRSLN